MTEAEVRKLFFVITNTFNFFDDNDDKVLLWMDYLHDIPFELAQRNLRAYALNPENSKPPHPGILARRPENEAAGPYIPSVVETRAMLEKQDREWANALPMPEHLRGRFRQDARVPTTP